MGQFPTFEQILEIQNISVDYQVQHWLNYELFTPQFWLLIAMFILPWFIWWRLVDKSRLLEIVVYGLLVQTIATFLDEVGCQLNWWEYIYDIEPLFPRLIPMNFSFLPVCYMLVYQYYPQWKRFMVANMLLAAVLAFVGEPLFISTGIYVMLQWKLWYSVPIYFLIAVILKLCMEAIMRACTPHERK